MSNIITEIHFDENAGVVFVRYTGVLDRDTMIAAATKINAVPGLRPGFGSFIDYQHCDISHLTADDIRHVGNHAADIGAWRGAFPVAFLVSSELAYGMSRMAAVNVDKNAAQIGAFLSLGPALEWVGLPADYPLPFEADAE